MTSYSTDQLINAVNTQKGSDQQFAQKLSAAVKRKEKNCLKKLIQDVALKIFGVLVEAIINAALNHFFALH